MFNLVTNLYGSSHTRENVESRCTCGWRSWITEAAAVNLSLITSKRLGAATIGMWYGSVSRPQSSSRIMDNKEWPNSSSESKRCKRLRRLVQSSSNSHLQYISTRGNSCTHVARTTWWEGGGNRKWRRHTSCHVQHMHCGGHLKLNKTQKELNIRWGKHLRSGAQTIRW